MQYLNPLFKTGRHLQSVDKPRGVSNMTPKTTICQIYGCNHYASHPIDPKTGAKLRFHYFPRDIER